MRKMKWGRLGAGLALAGILGLGACAPKQPVVTPTPKEPMPVVETPKVAPVPAGPLTVALLLPLTGDASGVGARLLHAAEAMLEDESPAVESGTPDDGAPKVGVFRGSDIAKAGTSMSDKSLRLLPIDTQGKPEAAVEAAKAAVKAGASLVVGPLFGANAQAVGPILAEAGIPALSLTNTRAAANEDMFVLGHAPQPQVERILTLAVENGQGRVLVVAPDSAYARLALEAARGLVDKGVTVVGADLYPANLEYNDLVNRVKGLARQPADVVLIPAGGNDLVGLSSLFQYFTQVGEKQLLGTILWENGLYMEREISLRGSRHVSTRLLRPKVDADSIVVGGLLEKAMEPTAAAPTDGDAPDAVGSEAGAASDAGAKPEAVTPEQQLLADALMAPDPIPAPPDFEEAEPTPEELARMPREPDNLEALVMDAVALAEVWSENRVNALHDYLIAPQGFEGASGRFRLKSDGSVERSYSVLELTRQGPVLVSAPVERFVGATATPQSLPRRQVPYLGDPEDENDPGAEIPGEPKEATEGKAAAAAL